MNGGCMTSRVDYVVEWLWNFGEIVPPFCVEIVLRDGSRYYLRSVSAKGEETKTLVLKIWDLRLLNDKADLDALKQRLNGELKRSELINEKNIHPKLGWAKLRIHLDDIAYCVEWEAWSWPEEESLKTAAHQ
jgi:hypothetical protein